MKRFKIKYLVVPAMSLLVGFSGLTNAIKDGVEARAKEKSITEVESYGFNLASYQDVEAIQFVATELWIEVSIGGTHVRSVYASNQYFSFVAVDVRDTNYKTTGGRVVTSPQPHNSLYRCGFLWLKVCERYENTRNKEARVTLETKGTAINDWAPKNKPESTSGSISLGAGGVSFSYNIEISEYNYDAFIHAPSGKFESVHGFKVAKSSWSSFLTNSIASSAVMTHYGATNKVTFSVQYYLEGGVTGTGNWTHDY